jgi:hypothetical protein
MTSIRNDDDKEWFVAGHCDTECSYDTECSHDTECHHDTECSHDTGCFEARSCSTEWFKKKKAFGTHVVQLGKLHGTGCTSSVSHNDTRYYITE